MTKKYFFFLTLLLAMATGAYAEVGDYFFVEVNGYDMKFEVISDTEVEVWGGTGSFETCIDRNVSGSISIPQSVVNPDDGKTYAVTNISSFAFLLLKKCHSTWDALRRF